MQVNSNEFLVYIIHLFICLFIYFFYLCSSHPWDTFAQPAVVAFINLNLYMFCWYYHYPKSFVQYPYMTNGDTNIHSICKINYYNHINTMLSICMISFCFNFLEFSFVFFNWRCLHHWEFHNNLGDQNLTEVCFFFFIHT